MKSEIEKRFMYILSNRIKSCRQYLGLTQRELAIKINVHENSISLYEQGIRCPSAFVLTKLALVLNVSTDYLLGLEG